METDAIVGNILSHHGVLGMKWGVRKRSGSPTSVSVKSRGKRLTAKGGKGHPAHVDAIIAKTAQQKLRKSGIKALSNEELRQLSTRMNLERQVVGNQKSTYEKGTKAVNEFINTPQGKTTIAGAKALARNEHVRRAISTGLTTATIKVSTLKK